MDLLRTKPFRKYVEDVVSYCYVTEKGISDAQARAEFRDNFYDDFNLLAFILPSTFPQTRREKDKYLFITDEMVHEMINGNNKKGNVGRCTLEINGREANITYENNSFKAGPIAKDGRITCYGAYRAFAPNVVKVGFAGALMDLYNFARVSDHNTEWGNIETYV